MLRKLALFALLATGFASQAHAGIDEVLAKFSAEEAKNCDDENETFKRKEETAIKSFPQGDGSAANVYVVRCTMAAYNSQELVYLESASGIQKLWFTEVSINGKNQITGFTTTDMIPGAGFDEKTGTLGSFMKGRGTGDAFYAGTYKWVNGAFQLVKWVEDNTFDGKFNPRTILDVTKIK